VERPVLKKGRYETMSIEKKYTEEEMKAFVAEEIRKMNLGMNRELSADELESVSGGNYVVPKTHEEIDRLWDSVEAVRKGYGQDVAYHYASELNLSSSPSAAKFAEYGTGHYRKIMHDVLDGKIKLDGGLDSYSAH
jgi:hypothetical protein